MVAYSRPVEVDAYSCTNCKQTVYARDTADSHTCFCGSVDCHGNLTSTAEQKKVVSVETKKVIVEASMEEIRRDFAYNGGHYGTILPEKK